MESKAEAPLVSVVLPVYNGAAYLQEAIDSILNQSYSNFEFIIINDGSKDDSEKMIQSYNDQRIRYYYQDNKGLGATLNIALNLCNGKYIARQDQDDVSFKDRFTKQVHFLEQNPNVILLGTRANIITSDNSVIGIHNHALNSVDLKFDLLFDNPFVHSTVMFRKSVIETVGNYNPDRNLFEDYNLWSRFSEVGDLANLPEVLLSYRHHESGLSSNTANFKEYALYDQGLINLEKMLGTVTIQSKDLEALYHWKKDKYSGSSIKELDKALSQIAVALVQKFPYERDRILAREKQYQKIIRYRLNISERRNNPDFLRMLMLKIENKLLRLHPFVKN